MNGSQLSSGALVRLTRPWMGIPTGAEGEVTEATPDIVSVVWRAMPAAHEHLVGKEDTLTALEAAALEAL